MLRPVDRTRFAATSVDGKVYPVRAFQMVDDAPDAGRPSNDPADWGYATTDDREVLRLGPGEYLIVDTNTVLLTDGGP